MSLFSGDASEIYELANDMTMVGAAAIPALRAAMDEAGRGFADDWRANARETAGVHGIHYPDSIDSELVFNLGGVSVDVGPNAAKKQGSMGRGFEFGSVNQSPHLDGLKAMPAAEARAEALVDQVIAGVFTATPVANPNELLSYTTKAGNTRLATQAQINNWTRGNRS